VPAPTPAQVNALELAGRHKKLFGGVLMGVGAGIALAGTGLMIAGAWDENGYCARHYDYRYHGTYAHCSESALTVAGVTTALFGSAVIVPGALIYASGGRDVAEAHRLRRCCWSSVSLRPTIGRTAAGLELIVRR
jgi:hypothetical protein